MSRHEFPLRVRREAWSRAQGICECGCGRPFDLNHPKGCPEYDHRIPAKMGGEASLENCLCIRRDCHAAKTSQEDMPRIKKVRREDKRRQGLQSARNPIPGSRASKWKRTVDGRTIKRDD